MSTMLLLVVLVVIAAAVFAAVTKKQKTAGIVGFPYQRTKALFSPAERSFLGVLDQAVGSEHRVFGKVRIADIAMVKSGLGPSAKQGALNRIAFKHFDFVICKASDLTIVCAIELNDKSHASAQAQARDALVTNVCQAIGLPLLSVPAKPAYSVHELRAQFDAVVSSSPSESTDGTRPRGASP